ncbi:hypothetical protein [Flavisolibacter tropicus]|uniref:Sensor of ECF-type sigma factor n=1 Tax=Flavisolibacter tropicus TaxID=1492898 RepID=A0A172TQG2_9BACT|nr:hypothetical protein [Flavisolibacter tropicus]ANE49222.1 hypothetical protein SY85_00590 [Flavisolibacter tropicus]
MKKILLVTIISLLAAPLSMLHAQDDIQKVQEAWGKDKKELVRIGMDLSSADSAKFWPLYDKYETERRKISREWILALGDYADNYTSMTNAKADELINKLFKVDAGISKLLQQYYGKVKSALNAMQAAKFVHIESYINTTIRSKMQESLPLIGEKMKTL